MTTIRDRPKGSNPPPLKPRLAANISNSRATPPPRLAARSVNSPASPAAINTSPRKPLVATTTTNARHSPAPSTTSAKTANSATPITRPGLRAARPNSTQSSPAVTNARATPTVTPSGTPTTAGRTLRKAPSSFFSPKNSTPLAQTTSATRPPLTKKTSSFVYANGEEEDAPAKSDRASDAQSIRSHRTVQSSGTTRPTGTQKKVNGTIRSTVTSPLLSASEGPRVIQSTAEVLSPAPVQTIPSTPAAQSEGGIKKQETSQNMVEGDNVTESRLTTSPVDLRDVVTPVHQVNRSSSPTESEKSTTENTPHVVRSTMSVDFPSKLPSPARRRSVDVRRKTSITAAYSPGHRKIQSVSSATPPPARLTRIDTGVPATIASEPLVSSPLSSRLPRLSIDAGASAGPSQSTTIAEGADIAEQSDQPDNEASTDKTIGAARHERKLLDLEISNSSLLAINRSLEKEVLKQKAELRRLRRATRGGGVNNRLSWLSEASMGDDMASDIGFSSPAGSGDFDQIGDENTPTKAYGQSVQSSVEPKNRLDLDLTKHKELLIDGQKMNLSLQRCLGMTEQLLRDAGKALEYQPRITSKVLTPDEQEQAEGDQSINSDYFINDWDWQSASKRHGVMIRKRSDGQDISKTDWPDASTDKDSGVDLDDGTLPSMHPRSDMDLEGGMI